MTQSKAAHDFLDPRHEFRRLFAELWGTFLLVLVACGGAVVSRTTTELNPAIAAAAPGLLVMAVIYFMGSVSGAHINPAVTLAFAVRGNFPWGRVPGYLVAQFAGGVLAVCFVRLVLGPVADLGATMPRPGFGTVASLALEIVLTAGLVKTILGTASGARNVGPNAAIAVGGYIALSGLWAGPMSGASMNPARSLSPDLVRGDFHTTWIYVLGPLVGAMIGVAFEWILKGPPTAEGTRAAQGES